MAKYTTKQYVDDVISGKITACKWVRLACQRHIDDLEHGHERGLWFDEKAAKVAIAFYSVVHHWKGEWSGEPITLEPWQQFIIWSVFGWKRADGTRRFRTVYLEVARKNGKTTMVAPMGLFLMTVDNEPGAEIYTVATKRDQARNKKRIHPTQKPVTMYKWLLEKYSNAGDITADYYLGGASHLVAAENLSRQCRAAEIAPAYVAVSLQRYVDAFGIQPELMM